MTSHAWRSRAALPFVGLSISSPEVLSIVEEFSLIINRDKTLGKFDVFKIHFLL